MSQSEGPLSSPLQNLFLFNGLLCLSLPSNHSLCLFAHSLLPLFFSSSKGQAACQGGRRLPAQQNGHRTKETSKQEEVAFRPKALGNTDVGLLRPPSDFYWGK
jgi:hypothetical protein